jgi:hypothetical protein
MDPEPLDDIDHLFRRLEPAALPAEFHSQTLSRARRAARRRLLWALADLLALGVLALMTFSLSWTLFSSDAAEVLLGLGADLFGSGASAGDLLTLLLDEIPWPQLAGMALALAALVGFTGQLLKSPAPAGAARPAA